MIKLLHKINISSENDYLKAISSSNKLGQKKIFFYLNSHLFYEAEHDHELKKLILHSDYLIADGYSIVFAIKILFKIKIEKVVFTYSYFKYLRNYFIDNNISIFYIGASKKNIIKAVKKENDKYPNLNIVGFHHGYFEKKSESEGIINNINKSNAEVLIVGMGCPIAEKWIMKNKLKFNPILIFSVGGFFDFVAEEKIGAPKWMYNSGLEWIFRLIQEPKRLLKRYIISNFYFIFTILKTKFKNGN